MAEKELDQDASEKKGVLSLRTSEVTKKRFLEAIDHSGKNPNEFLQQVLSLMQEEENQTELPPEWKPLENQIRTLIPLLASTWNQTGTILQQERIEIEKLRTRIQESNVKHAEKLLELEKREEDLKKKLEESNRLKEDAESRAESDRTRSEQATATFNAIKNRAEELEAILRKQKSIVEKSESIESELSMMKKEFEHKDKVQQHELQNDKMRLGFECQEKILEEKAKRISESEEYQRKIKELNSNIEMLKKESHELKDKLLTATTSNTNKNK